MIRILFQSSSLYLVRSDRYEDELIWAAAWLYKATGESEYLTKAEEMYASRQQTWVSWSFDWADKLPGAQLLLYELTGKSKSVLVIF